VNRRRDENLREWSRCSGIFPLSAHGFSPLVSIGELFEMGNLVARNGRQMREADFERAGGVRAAIESHSDSAVFADL